MKKIFKSKKGWLSMGAILVALTLIVGATFAWFSYVGGEELNGNLDAGTLVLETNLPSADWLQSEIDNSLNNGVAQPGQYIKIYPEDGEDYFTVKNVGSLDAMVRISGADVDVTLNAVLDNLGNYVGGVSADYKAGLDAYNAAKAAQQAASDAYQADPTNQALFDAFAAANAALTAAEGALVGVTPADAFTYYGTFGKDLVITGDTGVYENGVIIGMKLIDGAADNDLVANDMADLVAIGMDDAIIHYYDWARGDHYFKIPVGKAIGFDLSIDLKTNAYEQVIQDFDPETFTDDFTGVVTTGPRDPAILLDNKYQGAEINLVDALGVKATQFDYTDAWMDIFNFFDGEWAAYGANYGILDDWTTYPAGTAWNLNDDAYGVDFFLPMMGDYFTNAGIVGNPNMLIKY